MSWLKNFFQKKPKTRLGLDLGSSTIKLVEISSGRTKPKLETYGLAQIKPKNVFEDGGQGYLKILSDKEISQVIKDLLRQTKTKTNIAYVSLPVFATFSTLIDLPMMPEEEMASAIPFEAKKYIPVPLDEVMLDWSVILTEPALNGQPAAGIRIMLVAVLKEVIERYTKISQLANLEIKILEAESFSLARSLIGQEKNPIVLIDIGSFFTDIALVRNGSVYVIHNAKKVLDPASGELNRESLAAEIERVINLYKTKVPQPEDIKCILTGGSSVSVDLVDYLKGRNLASEVLIGDPFSQIDYPKVLAPVLKEVGPALSVAVGLAMRE